MIETVHDYYAAVDSGDVEAVLSLFAQDCVYERPGYAPLLGHGDMRRFYSEDRVIAEGKHTITTVVEQGTLCAVEGGFEGVLKSGKQVSIRFSDFFEMAGDVIARRRSYFFTPSV